MFDFVSALGLHWGEPGVRDLLASLRIEAEPRLKRGDYTAYLHNHRLGVELTFNEQSALDVPVRDYPAGALVLSNIRLYGAKSGPFEPFTGKLPFELRFGDSTQALIERLGPPDVEGRELGLLMRWDTERYALFAQFSDAGTLNRVSVQTPVVRSTRPGFQ